MICANHQRPSSHYLQDIRRFTGFAPPSDDITLMVIKVL
jgi:hypothetical protein